MIKVGETCHFEAKFVSVTGAALTGATVTVNVYNPSGALVVSAGAATETAGGRYEYSYVSDAVGVWNADFVTAHADADLLSISVSESVVSADYFETDISGLTAQLNTIDGKVDTIDGKVDTIDGKVDTIDGKVDTIDGKVDTIDGQLNTIDGKADTIDGKVDTIDGKLDTLQEDMTALTENPEGDPIVRVIPPPVSGDACVIYEYCYDQSSGDPLTSVTATARIMSLPYDYNGKLHIKSEIAGTYNVLTGLCSWEIVQGALVTISIAEVGLLAHVTVPAATEARILDLIS